MRDVAFAGNDGAKNPIQPAMPALMDVHGVAVYLKCSPRTVAQLAATGELRSIKIARLRRYRVEDLLAFVAKNLSGGAEGDK